jgi:hypothetical protein
VEFAGATDKDIPFGGIFFRANARLQLARRCQRQQFDVNARHGFFEGLNESVVGRLV